MIQSFKIGNAAITALPGEQFIETALNIKKTSRERRCFVMAYANNCEIGYIPTAKAFKKGGYEVDSAYKYYGDFVYRCSPEASDFFIRESVKLCKENK